MGLLRFLLKQFNDIKKRGIKELLKKIKIFITLILIYPFYILSILVAAPVVILIRIIKPFIHIRFCTINTAEFGHFVYDAGILLCESVLNNNKIRNWYWLEPAYLSGKKLPICNNQIERMVKRTFYVRWWVKYLYNANNIIPGGKQYNKSTPRNIGPGTDQNGLIYKTKELKKTYFTFSQDEQAQAKKYLQNIGLNEKDKFVCLNVRDSSYKNHIDPNRNWSYHDFRNTDIDTYTLAALALAEKGYWVFRMGKIVFKSFNCKHPKVIDYASSNKKNDLLDIWLQAHCSFSVSSGSGLDSAPLIFRRPTLFVNFIPVGDIVTSTPSLFYFKHLRWKKKNRALNLKENLDNEYLTTNEYISNGIDVVDLTADEIKDATLEMEDRISGVWLDKSEDIKLQVKFWDIFKKWHNFKIKHGYVHPNAKVSTVLLRNNPDWLDVTTYTTQENETSHINWESKNANQ